MSSFGDRIRSETPDYTTSPYVKRIVDRYVKNVETIFSSPGKVYKNGRIRHIPSLRSRGVKATYKFLTAYERYLERAK